VKPQALLPRETLLLLVGSSPLVAVLLSRAMVEGPWSTRLHVGAGVFAYCVVLAVSLWAVFEGLLARLPPAVRRRPVRFVVYWVATALVTYSVSFTLSPLFDWMGVSRDPIRHGTQGTIIVSFYLVVTLLFKRMGERLAAERSLALSERAAALDARYQALQARTNPHFLFNSLNSVMSLIGKDPALAEEMLGRLATLLRYALDVADRPYVTLREELAMIEDYLEIERVRFGERLRVEVRVGGDVDLSTPVPPMVLQPLVENAVLHGTSRSAEGIRISVTAARREDRAIELCVDDDGAAGSLHVGTGTSLCNLEERLEIAYAGRATFVAGQKPRGGFRAVITLPAGALP
jgi:two-component system sensor histidine kinase AlgZ